MAEQAMGYPVKFQHQMYYRKRMQSNNGFPMDFKMPVSRTQMYRQFGNSVAVPVVTAIAKELVKSLRNVIRC